jgi:hypothetical protein
MEAAGADDTDVPAGTAIGLSVADGVFSHTYITGPGTPARISGGPRNSVAGLPAFAAADIRYDLANGTIGFRANASSAPGS